MSPIHQWHIETAQHCARVGTTAQAHYESNPVPRSDTYICWWDASKVAGKLVTTQDIEPSSHHLHRIGPEALHMAPLKENNVFLKDNIQYLFLVQNNACNVITYDNSFVIITSKPNVYINTRLFDTHYTENVKHFLLLPFLNYRSVKPGQTKSFRRNQKKLL